MIKLLNYVDPRTFYYGFLVICFLKAICKRKHRLVLLSTVCVRNIYNSVIREAPSNAFSSMPVIWFLRKSSLTKLGRRPNKPSDRILPSSLSCSNL